MDALLIESMDVRKAGSSSLALTLTHHLKQLGLEQGDYVSVVTYPDKIIIRRDDNYFRGKERVTLNIDSKLYKKFNGNIDEAIKIYNSLTDDNLLNVFKNVVNEHESKQFTQILRELIDNYISKYTKWYRILDRPLIKI